MINIFPVDWTFTLADLLVSALVAALFGGLVAGWVRRSGPVAPALPARWAVSARPVLGARERRLYQRLRSAFPGHLILPKLALVRFCQPDDASLGRYWHGLLGSSHVTFAVCSAEGIVVLAVDLEGARPRSRRSLQVRQGVLAACGVEHLRVSSTQLPDVSELRAVLPSLAIADGERASPAEQTSLVLDAARTTLATTVAARRAQRKPKWQDSSLFQDSFFSPDSVTDTADDLVSRSAARGATTASATPGTPQRLKVDARELPLTMGR